MITYEDLERDPWHANMIAVLKREHGDPLPNSIKEYLVDQARWAEVGPSQVLQWCERLHDVTDRIRAKAANSSDYDIFWIRLNGVIEELASYFSPVHGVQLPEKAVVYEKISALQQCFSENELLWIEHERHCQSHPTPAYYRKGIRKEGDKWVVKDTYAPKRTRRDLNIDDLTARLRSVITPYKADSTALAYDLSVRIYPHVFALREAVWAYRHQ